MVDTFKPHKDIDFYFEGERYNLKANEAFDIPYYTACDKVDFIWTATKATGSDVVYESKPGSFQALVDACKNEVAELPPLPTPTAPGSISDPSKTGTDTPPPEGQESADSLKAPQPLAKANEVSSSYKDDPGTSDGRPLATQLYDPRNPMPDYDIRNQLSSQGVPDDKLENAFQDTLHNKAEDGKPHPFFGTDNSKHAHKIGDPVIIFTGQYSLNVTDVQIPSRGFPLQLTRVYRSGPVYFGPWGYNWDHNYNIYLRQLIDGGVAIWGGNLDENVFKRGTDGSFEPPIGLFCKLERQLSTSITDERYVLSDNDGMRQIFERPDGWPHTDRLPLSKIEDRHGNSHRLFYDSDGRLDHVVDHAGRFIKFKYGECGLLENVSDHTGRVWHYHYDSDIEHLIGVTTPSVVEYPKGLTTSYEYDRSRQHPVLLHNLTKVIDPAGQLLVENTYGDDPDTEDFCRVIYQEFGGFEASYHTTSLQYVPRTPAAIDVPAWRVEVVDPGVLHVYTFNYRGDLLDERSRLVLDGSYRLVARTYRYDEQGNRIESREPNGLGKLYTYDHLNIDPRARGNLLKVELIAPPTRPSVSRIISVYRYESRFHRLKEIRDEKRITTKWIYDYEEGVGTVGDVIHIRHPDVKLPDGTVQKSIEDYYYNEYGQVKRYESGENYVTTFDYHNVGLQSGYLKKITQDNEGSSPLTSELHYDSYGNVNSITDGLSNKIEYIYDSQNHLRTIFLPDVEGVKSEIRYDYDKMGLLSKEYLPRGNYTDNKIADDYILNKYEYNIGGSLIYSSIGKNTASAQEWHYKRDAEGRPLEITDPIGRKTVLSYDERGLVLSHTFVAGTTETVSQTLKYDRNGNLSSINDSEGNAIDYKYDSWDRLYSIKFPNRDERNRTTLIYEIGKNDRVTQMTLEGVTELDSLPKVMIQERFVYDERGRLTNIRQNELNHIIWYDRDSRPKKLVDPRNNSHNMEYDGVNRVTYYSDPAGNVKRMIFDAAGNMTELIEEDLSLTEGEPEIYRYVLGYDSRCRMTSIIDPLKNITKRYFDARNLPVLAVDALEHSVTLDYDLNGLPIRNEAFVGSPPKSVVNQWRRDLIGRLEEYEDPETSVTGYKYTLHDQLKSIVYPDKSEYILYYHGTEIKREVLPSGTEIKYTSDTSGRLFTIDVIPGHGVATTSSMKFFYDGLDRPIEIHQGSNVLARKYDEFSRILMERYNDKTIRLIYNDLKGFTDLVYPDGRIDRYNLDNLGRLSKITYLQPGLENLFEHIVPKESTLASYSYFGVDRIHSRTLFNGTRTSYTYDYGRRLSSLVHYDPEIRPLVTYRYVYDAANHLRIVYSEPLTNHSAFYEYDELSRLTSGYHGMSLSLPGVINSQEEANDFIKKIDVSSSKDIESFSLDRADNRLSWKKKDKMGTIVAYDATTNILNQLTQLKTSDVSGSSLSRLDYDLNGNLKQDSNYIFTYDGFGQLVKVQRKSTGKTVFVQHFDPLSRVYLREFEDGTKQRTAYAGLNAIHQDYLGKNPVQFVFGAGLDELVCKSQPKETYWGHQDSLLSLIATTDKDGRIGNRYKYTSFGTPSTLNADGITPADSASTKVSPLFAGRPFIEQINLYDMRSRLYDPNRGQFTQRDPQGYVDSPCPYVYCIHNPVDLIDPLGEIAPQAAAAIIGGIAGGIIGGVSTYWGNPNADRWDIIEGIAVGTLSGAVSGFTFGASTGALARIGLGAVSSGIISGSASGITGGVIGGGWYGGRKNYITSGGDITSTLKGAAYGAGREGIVGGIGGAASGGVGGRMWSSIVTKGALGRGMNLAISRGAPAPYARISPNSILGAAQLTIPSAFSGSAAQGMANATISYIEGSPSKTLGDHAKMFTLNLFGELGGFGAQRYIPGSPMYNYAQRYQQARTPGGAASARSVGDRAVRLFRDQHGLGGMGGEVHHERAVAGYPELADNPDIFTWLPSRRAHIDEHNNFRAPGETGPWSQIITHGPKTPRLPWQVNTFPVGSFLHSGKK